MDFTGLVQVQGAAVWFHFNSVFTQKAFLKILRSAGEDCGFGLISSHCCVCGVPLNDGATDRKWVSLWLLASWESWDYLD